MKRRKFFLASGSALLGSTGLYSTIQNPSVAVDFTLETTDQVDPSNVQDVLIGFSKFNLYPKYIENSELATITIKVDIDGGKTEQAESKLSLTDRGKITKSDLGSAVPIRVSDVGTSNAFIYGSVEIQIDHPDITDDYRQRFVIGSSDVQLFESDLIGWWPLSEYSGSALDYSSNENDSSVNQAEQGFAGKGGLQAYRFDGSEEVEIPNISAYDVNSFTVSSWVKIKSKTDAGIISNYGTNSNDQHYGIRYGSNSGDYVPSVYYDDGESTGYDFTILYGNTDIGDGEWHHVAGTWDGENGEVSIYVDGVRENNSTDDYQGSLNPSADLLIGNDAAGSHSYFNGLICDCRLYESALDDGEITEIYNQGSSDTVKPPAVSEGGAVYWPLNEDPSTNSEANDEWSDKNGTFYGDIQNASNSIRGSAVRFTASEDQAIRADQNVGISNEATMSIWIDVRGKGDTSYNRYITYDDSTATNGAGDNEMTIFWDADGAQWGCSVETQGSGVRCLIPENVPKSDWIHASAVWNGDELILYQNGQERVRKQKSGTFDDTNCKLTVGNRSDIATDHVDAYIDEARLYDKALSKSQIRRIYLYGTRGSNLQSEIEKIR